MRRTLRSPASRRSAPSLALEPGRGGSPLHPLSSRHLGASTWRGKPGRHRGLGHRAVGVTNLAVSRLIDRGEWTLSQWSHLREGGIARVFDPHSYPAYLERERFLFLSMHVLHLSHRIALARPRSKKSSQTLSVTVRVATFSAISGRFVRKSYVHCKIPVSSPPPGRLYLSGYVRNKSYCAWGHV